MENQTTKSLTEKHSVEISNEKGEGGIVSVERNHTIHEKWLLPPSQEAIAYEQVSPGTIHWLKERATAEQVNRHEVNLAQTKNDPHYVAAQRDKYIFIIAIVSIPIALVCIVYLFAIGRDAAGFTVTAVSLIVGLASLFKKRNKNEKP